MRLAPSVQYFSKHKEEWIVKKFLFKEEAEALVETMVQALNELSSEGRFVDKSVAPKPVTPGEDEFDDEIPF